MLDAMIQLGLWLGFAVIAAIMLINAAIMLVSPRAWFGLPKWLGLQGVLTLERYGNRWGSFQVRILGGIIIGTFVWIAIEVLPTIHKA